MPNNPQIASLTKTYQFMGGVGCPHHLGSPTWKSACIAWLLRQEMPRPCDTVHASFHPFPPRSPVITKLPTVDEGNMTFKVCWLPEMNICAQISSSWLSVYWHVRSWYWSVWGKQISKRPAWNRLATTTSKPRLQLRRQVSGNVIQQITDAIYHVKHPDPYGVCSEGHNHLDNNKDNNLKNVDKFHCFRLN